MTADDEKIAESIAFRSANIVADRAVQHIEQTTLVALGSAQKEIEGLRREHELKIEALRNERELKLASQAQERHAEIAAHAAGCPTAKSLLETKETMQAILNKGYGVYVAVALLASTMGAIIVFFGPVLLKHMCP